MSANVLRSSPVSFLRVSKSLLGSLLVNSWLLTAVHFHQFVRLTAYNFYLELASWAQSRGSQFYGRTQSIMVGGQSNICLFLSIRPMRVLSLVMSVS